MDLWIYCPDLPTCMAIVDSNASESISAGIRCKGGMEDPSAGKLGVLP